MLTWKLFSAEKSEVLAEYTVRGLEVGHGGAFPHEIARDIAKVGLPGEVIEIRTRPAAGSHCVPVTHRFRIDARGGLIPLRAIVHSAPEPYNWDGGRCAFNGPTCKIDDPCGACEMDARRADLRAQVAAVLRGRDPEVHSDSREAS
jgi:hypothetical protein